MSNPNLYLKTVDTSPEEKLFLQRFEQLAGAIKKLGCPFILYMGMTGSTFVTQATNISLSGRDEATLAQFKKLSDEFFEACENHLATPNN